MIRAPFCRQGNKNPILEDIKKLVPKHKIYCEPFTGSGIVFFNLPKADLSILNDLDRDVYERLKLLQKAPLQLTNYRSDLNTLKKIKDFYNNHTNSIPDLILYHKIKACSGFSGKPVYNTDSIYHIRNPASICKNLEYYKTMLKNVKITNEDYIKIIKKYDSTETFFFIDPPYENTSENFYLENNIIDYNDLFFLLQNIKGKFLLTLNDSLYIRKIFKNFIIKKITVKSFWQGKKDRKELLIMNYYL